MRYILLLLCCFSAAAQVQHCGYDFTSYIVIHAHEDGKKENISGLRLTLIDSTGNDLANIDNRFSWNHANEVLVFKENYPLEALKTEQPVKPKWFFPYAQDVYFLSVTNEFPADGMRVKISDPNKRYESAIVELQAFNLYVLCTSQARQFGKRLNKPIDIVLRKIR